MSGEQRSLTTEYKQQKRLSAIFCVYSLHISTRTSTRDERGGFIHTLSREQKWRQAPQEEGRESIYTFRIFMCVYIIRIYDVYTCSGGRRRTANDSWLNFDEIFIRRLYVRPRGFNLACSAATLAGCFATARIAVLAAASDFHPAKYYIVSQLATKTLGYCRSLRYCCAHLMPPRTLPVTPPTSQLPS